MKTIEQYYIVILSTSVKDLITEVNDALELGYIPVGGITVQPTSRPLYYMQAMWIIPAVSTQHP